MRFAFAGIDFLSGVYEALVAAGWEPVKLFTRPCDGVYDHNDTVVARARAARIPIQLSRLMPADVEELARRHGPETALVVAGYPWLVRGWGGRLRRALNVHPSPLPTGRGPYPLFRAVLEGYETWGVSAHVLSEDGFDAGDLLAQELFPLPADACHESLLALCQMAAGRLATRLAADLPGLWVRAEPQGDGSYWPRAGDGDRTLDFREPVATVLRRVRAFGSIETIAQFGESRAYVAEATGWAESHPHAPGTIVHRHRRHLVVAAKDGYVQVLRWSAVPLADAAGLGR